jgi:hypothetical protein
MVDIPKASVQIAQSVLEYVESAGGDFLNHPNLDLWQSIHGDLPGVPFDWAALVQAVSEGDRESAARQFGDVASSVASAGAQAAAILLAMCQDYVNETMGPEHAAAMLARMRDALSED